MIAAVANDDAWMHPYQAEWQSLRARRHNVLLEGSGVETHTVLHRLQPYLREPIRRCEPKRPLTFPSGETGALILRDVMALGADDQARLLEWLAGDGSRTQIVSTTDRPLYALVAQGLFDTTLYYRLNVILLRVGSGNRSGLPNDDDECAHSGVDSPTTVSTS